MPSRPKLTMKQAKFVKAKAEGKTGTEAAMIAYNVKDETVASAISSENLRKPSIQEAMHIALEKQGITPDRIAGIVNDGMVASKIVTSPTEPDYEVPDHNVRLKAAGMAATFMGVKQGDNTTTVNNFGTIVAEMKDKYAD